MYFSSVLHREKKYHKEEGGKKEEISRLPVLPSFWPPAGQETTIFFRVAQGMWPIETSLLTFYGLVGDIITIYIQKVHKCGTRDAEDF